MLMLGIPSNAELEGKPDTRLGEAVAPLGEVPNTLGAGVEAPDWCRGGICLTTGDPARKEDARSLSEGLLLLEVLTCRCGEDMTAYE